MTSILDNRPLLKAEIDKVAEVAGYLWQKGWAERNGGNITINITEWVDDAMRALPAIGPSVPIGTKLPELEGCWFYCKGTGRRMRDLARDPMAHLSVHNYLLAKGSPYRASLHTHPIELVALTHSRKWMEKDVATRMLWSMIPETKAFCPRGLGMVPYMLPSSVDLAEATIQAIDEDYDVVMWEKHGVFAVDTDVMSAFDQVDVLNKSAQIYIAARNMGSAEIGSVSHRLLYR